MVLEPHYNPIKQFGRSSTKYCFLFTQHVLMRVISIIHSYVLTCLVFIHWYMNGLNSTSCPLDDVTNNQWYLGIFLTILCDSLFVCLHHVTRTFIAHAFILFWSSSSRACFFLLPSHLSYINHLSTVNCFTGSNEIPVFFPLHVRKHYFVVHTPVILYSICFANGFPFSCNTKALNRRCLNFQNR